MRRAGVLTALVYVLLSYSVVSAPSERFIDDAGSGSTCSEVSPCSPKTAALASSAGDFITALDGTYTGADYMIDPIGQGWTGKSGVNGAPITLRAKNDGQVHFDGEYARRVARLQGNSWWELEGFNVSRANANVFEFQNGSRNNVVRRVCAFNGQGYVGGFVFGGDSTGNLLEDTCAFGYMRSAYHEINATGNTYRRAWGRFDGTLNAPDPVGTPVTYQSSYQPNPGTSRYENVIGIWAGNIDLGKNFAGSRGTFLFRDVVPSGTFYEVLGSIFYRIPGGNSPNIGNVQHNSGRTKLQDVFSDDGGYDRLPVHLGCDDPVACPNATATRLTTVRGTTVSVVRDAWTLTNGNEYTSIGALPAGVPYTNATHAQICKRYVDGSLTAIPLFPWPMDSRIKAAIDIARAQQSGTKSLLLAGDGTVTGEIEARYGIIPSDCLGAAPPPQNDKVQFVGAGALAGSDTLTSVAIPLPPGVQQDDLIHLACASRLNGSATFSASGYSHVTGSPVFKEIGFDDLTLAVLRKLAGASESDPTVTIDNASGGWTCFSFVHRFADTTTTDDATPTTSTANAGTSLIPGSITTVTNNAEIISVVASAGLGDLNLSAPASFAERAVGSAYDTQLGPDHALGMADKEQVTAGAASMPTWDIAVSGESAWITLAIRWNNATPVVPVGIMQEIRSGEARPTVSQQAPVTQKVPRTQ